MTLIALHGDQGAGKDAIAKILVEQHGFTRFAFADRLKAMCEAFNPIIGYRDDLQMHAQIANGEPVTFRPVRLCEVITQHGWDQAKRFNSEVRRTQQYLATEVIRDFVSDTYWADAIERDIKAEFDKAIERAKGTMYPLGEAPKIVITDLRFESEYDMVRRNHGVIWWVHRPHNPHVQAAAHRSEAWHPPFYRKIDNSGSIDDLAHIVADNLRFWKTQIPHEVYEAGLV